MVDAENWMAHPDSAQALLNLFRHPKTPRQKVIPRKPETADAGERLLNAAGVGWE